MSNLLSTAKKLLANQAIELYTIMGEDIPLTKGDFERHYEDLGRILFEIESCETLGELIIKIEKNVFVHAGFFEEELEDFLDRVKKYQ